MDNVFYATGVSKDDTESCISRLYAAVDDIIRKGEQEKEKTAKLVASMAEEPSYCRAVPKSILPGQKTRIHYYSANPSAKEYVTALHATAFVPFPSTSERSLKARGPV